MTLHDSHSTDLQATEVEHRSTGGDMPAEGASERPPICPAIRLVVTDVDGTLIDGEKRLTERAIAAVDALRARGIAFAITSARPPNALRGFMKTLAVSQPTGCFNGGFVIDPDGAIVHAASVEADVVETAIAYLKERGVDVWAYTRLRWLVDRPLGSFVDREAETLGFEPTFVPDVLAELQAIAPERTAGKIVGASADHDLLADCERELQTLLPQATVARSRPHYLDITHGDANKGAFVRFMMDRLGMASDEVLVLGDGANDLSMFDVAGTSVAMAQSDPKVRERADHISGSNDDEGFARAVEDLVLAGAVS